MPDPQAWLELSNQDPFLFYTSLAAAFLAAVSLLAGWRRGDFIAVLKPQGLLHVSVAVLCGFALLWLRHALLEAENPLPQLESVSRFPLYVVTLAYGPSAGLLSAGLFAAFAASSSLPNWPEAVLALELVVLGWFAIAPSPRESRWAGPLGGALAYVLAWATGGSAMLQYLTGNGTSWATQWSYHQQLLLGVGLSLLALFLLGPGFYRRFFPGSRIAPRPPKPGELRRTEPAAPQAASEPRRRQRQGLTLPALEPFDAKPRRPEKRALDTPPLPEDVPRT